MKEALAVSIGSSPSGLKRIRLIVCFVLIAAVGVSLFLAELSIGAAAIPFGDVVRILASGDHSNVVFTNIVW